MASNGMGWLRSNLSIVITVILLLIAFVAQWSILQSKTVLIDQVAQEVKTHELDTAHHIDPERDERRWQELLRRLDRIEAKLDAVSK